MDGILIPSVTPLPHNSPGGVAGTKIGGFMILRKLGEGGMGVVYAAYDPRLDRNVALKVIHPKRTNAAALSRFIREAKGLGRISHPNVVQVHESGIHRGGMYIAMEYVPGLTLQRWLEPKRDWREVLDVLIQAGRGLEAAHRAKLVHRDFKPGNVMVAEDGRVRVLDFGLVCGMGESEDEELTLSGSQPGTPTYMAPEQIEGGEVDHLSDQFAFCMVAFEALYRVRPFGGGPLLARATRMMMGKITPRPSKSKVPRRVHEAILRGLEVAPGRRWPNMSALLGALEQDSKPGRLVIRVGAGLLSCVLAVVIAKLYSLVEERDAMIVQNVDIIELQEATIQDQQNTINANDATQQAQDLKMLALSPGERSAALVRVLELYAAWRGEGPPAIEAAVFAATEGLHDGWEALPSDQGAIVDAIFAGGTVILLTREGGATRHDVQTGESLGHADFVGDVEFSPDGEFMLVIGLEGAASLRDTRTGRERILAERGVVIARFTPDRQRLLLGDLSGRVQAWTLGSNFSIAPEFELELGAAPRELIVSPDGARMLSADDRGIVNLWRLGSNARAVRLDGALVDPRTLAFCADGTRVATADASGSLNLWDGESGEYLETLVTGHGTIQRLACSARSSALVSVGKYGAPIVWDTLEARRITSLLGHRLQATDAFFAPDGETLATLGYDSMIRLWDSETGQLLDILAGQPSIHVRGQFSPDGEHLAVLGMDGALRTWRMQSSTEESLIGSRGHEVRAMAISPDQSRIAMGEAGQCSLWDAQGRRLVASLDHRGARVHAVVFSADGRWLATGDSEGRVRIWDAQTGSIVRDMLGAGPVFSLAFWPDGARLVAGDIQGRVLEYRLESGEFVELDFGAAERRGRAISSLAVSSDGSRLAIASLARGADSGFGEASRVRVWDLRTKELIWSPRIDGLVFVLAFSDDGKRLAIAGHDMGFVRVANLTGLPSFTGRPQPLDLASDDFMINALDFSPDGSQLLTGGKQMQLWDLEPAWKGLQAPPARPIAAFDSDVELWMVAFSSDGEWFYRGSAEGEVLRSVGRVERRVELACDALEGTRNYAGAEDACVRTFERRPIRYK